MLKSLTVAAGVCLALAPAAEARSLRALSDAFTPESAMHQCQNTGAGLDMSARCVDFRDAMSACMKADAASVATTATSAQGARASYMIRTKACAKHAVDSRVTVLD